MRKGLVIFVVVFLGFVWWVSDATASTGQLIYSGYFVGMEDGRVLICKKAPSDNQGPIVPLNCQEYVKGVTLECLGAATGKLVCED